MADYEHVPVPPEGRPVTEWEREHMVPSGTSDEVDFSDLDDPLLEWQRLGMSPDDGSGDGWFDSPQLDGPPDPLD